MPIRITTYQEALGLINAKMDDSIKNLFMRLASEGRSEKSISFAIWKSQNKLRQYRYDPRFLSVLENEIKKWSWSRDDPRWQEYNARKQEEEKAKQIQQEQLKYKAMKLETRFSGPGFIYFIQGSTGGPIKIGYTTNVEQRLKELQTGYPDTLIILCVKRGWPSDEVLFHKGFAEHRLKGEWFKPHQDILDTIEKIKKKNDDLVIKVKTRIEKFK